MKELVVFLTVIIVFILNSEVLTEDAHSASIRGKNLKQVNEIVK